LKKVFLVEDLPKTRSGKIMRRILKRLFTLQTFEKQKLGGLTGEEFGDLSTLSNPQSVRKIKEVINKVNSRV
ncbi:MAG: hypothetical protein CO144_01640, partial [Candidatus Nealsonbacteria bacterium CG_4_9_14_3_um_filter_35_11]